MLLLQLNSLLEEDFAEVTPNISRPADQPLTAQEAVQILQLQEAGATSTHSKKTTHV